MKRLAAAILFAIAVVAASFFLPVGVGWLFAFVLPFSWFESTVVACIGLAALAIMTTLHAIADDVTEALTSAARASSALHDSDDDDEDDDESVIADSVVAEMIRRPDLSPQDIIRRRVRRKQQRNARKQTRKR